MTLADDMRSMYQHTKDVYDAVEALGGTLPEHQNLESLASTFETIPVKSSWDPNNPTLEGLKYAIDNNIDVAIGTEIPDEYDGNSNPLIVAQYLDDSNNSSYGGAEGVILVRKYVEPTSYKWNDGRGKPNYPASLVDDFLSSTYYDNTSSSLKNMMSDISIPVATGEYNNWNLQHISRKWFLLSDTEIYSNYNDYSRPAEGIAFNYWKQQIGTSTPTKQANSGRVVYNIVQSANAFALRSQTGINSFLYVSTNGAVNELLTDSSSGVLPACFIAKSTSVADDPQVSSAIAAIHDATIGTEIEDTYAGVSNPLIVAQHLDSSNNADYGGAVGTILVRKYPEPLSKYGTLDYSASTVKEVLDTTYLENCSDSTKAMIGDITVPYYNGTENVGVTGKWFLMSDAEVMGANGAGVEGFGWDYWEQQTGLTTPSAANNTGRAIKTRDGSSSYNWLRSRYDNSYPCYINYSGSIGYTGTSKNYSILPACFVPKK